MQGESPEGFQVEKDSGMGAAAWEGGSHELAQNRLSMTKLVLASELRRNPFV